MSFWGKLKIRKQLINAFRAADLYKTIADDRKIYPRIHAVDIDAETKTTTIIFFLLNGLNPNILQKNFYVFQQFFGKSVQLTGEIKKFTLTISKVKSTKVEYDSEKLLAMIKNDNILMPIVAGQDSSGNTHIYDATNNPNLLIYGEPGSGKSSILHVILSTLIQLYSSDQLHLILADFKQSELNLYEGVQHVKSISYLPKELAPALRYLKTELTRRGALLKDNRVRHINKLPEAVKPPYIVLCIDEFVMINDDDIMADLLQIASLGRAYGIYLILAMQRPSHKILSTDVRGVLSVRIGFRTVDRRNANIGETPGSENISKDEPGKFLLNLDELTELRAPYLNEDMTEAIIEKYRLDDWKNHNFVTKPESKDAGPKEKQLTEEDVFNDN